MFIHFSFQFHEVGRAFHFKENEGLDNFNDLSKHPSVKNG